MKTQSFFSKCLQIISVVLLGIVFAFLCFFNTTVSCNLSEIVTIENDSIKSLLFLVLIAVFVFLFSFFKKYMEKINTNYLFLSCSAIYVLMAIYLIVNVDHSLRYDQEEVALAAKELLAGNFAVFGKGEYIYQYPHQIGLMLYEAFLFLFVKSNVILFAANVAFVLGTNFMIYKICDLIFEDKLTNNIAVILAFAFLPQFFFLIFAYGTVSGLFFLLFAFYHTLRFCKTRRWLNLVLVVLGSCGTVLLRKNFLIGVIAIIIFICLDMLKKFSFKHLLLILCVLISLILPIKVLPAVFVGDGNGAPSVLWLAMGTDIDNNGRGPGWYDGSSNFIFTASDYDTEISAEKGKEKLVYNFEKIKQEPVQAVKFFTRKIISQWCDPTYQSLWVGPLEDANQQAKTPLLDSLYTGGLVAKLFSNGMKLYMLTFFGLSFVFVLRYHKKYYGWELLVLIFIGGFIFHVFWEAKSQYIYPYFFSLLPFSAFVLSKLFAKVESITKKTR